MLIFVGVDAGRSTTSDFFIQKHKGKFRKVYGEGKTFLKKNMGCISTLSISKHTTACVSFSLICPHGFSQLTQKAHTVSRQTLKRPPAPPHFQPSSLRLWIGTSKVEFCVGDQLMVHVVILLMATRNPANSRTHQLRSRLEVCLSHNS